VHLCDFPVADGTSRDPALEEQMRAVMTVVRLGRQLRAENNMKVRQPLSAMQVVCRNADMLRRVAELAWMVREELNVKEIRFGPSEAGLAVLKAKAEFSRLGPRFGPKVKQVAAAIAAMDGALIEKLAGGESVEIRVDGETIELAPADVAIRRWPHEGLIVASAGVLIVGIETKLSEELMDEGLAREFVSRVQNMRKRAGLEVTQRILLIYCAEDDVSDALEAHADYIKDETLTLNLERVEIRPLGAQDLDLNGRPCAISLSPEGGSCSGINEDSPEP
jgi:isoleucyl-tRNA synthetase